MEPQTWHGVRERLADLAAELHAAARPPHTPGTVPVGVSVLAFQLRYRVDRDG